jgi:membrane protein implicated in regulation of membrane protease activity
MQRIYALMALGYFIAATFLLMILALTLLVIAAWGAVASVLAGEGVRAALDAIAILIIGFAVMETANFIAEEEIVRKRELRSSRESRRSITKFITIIVIAMSLEALVMVFRSSSEGYQLAIYPTALFMAAMLALVSLGIYQWLSSRIGEDAEAPRDIAQDEDSDEVGEIGGRGGRRSKPAAATKSARKPVSKS